MSVQKWLSSMFEGQEHPPVGYGKIVDEGSQSYSLD